MSDIFTQASRSAVSSDRVLATVATACITRTVVDAPSLPPSLGTKVMFVRQRTVVDRASNTPGNAERLKESRVPVGRAHHEPSR